MVLSWQRLLCRASSWEGCVRAAPGACTDPAPHLGRRPPRGLRVWTGSGPATLHSSLSPLWEGAVCPSEAAACPVPQALGRRGPGLGESPQPCSSGETRDSSELMPEQRRSACEDVDFEGPGAEYCGRAVSRPQNSYVEIVTPQVMVLGGGGLWGD